MIKILEENDFFMIVIKPSGMSSHNEKPSLLDELNQLKKPVFLANRLDVETSGLMVVAKAPAVQSELTPCLANGRKIYRTLGRGGLKNPDSSLQVQQDIKIPLSDKAEGRRLPAGKKIDQVNCQTLITPVRSNKYLTEFLCEIKTGRQHQIRKHLCLLGHPIVGDKRYNESAYNQNIADRYKRSRLELHAESLEFIFREKIYSFKDEFDLNLYF